MAAHVFGSIEPMPTTGQSVMTDADAPLFAGQPPIYQQRVRERASRAPILIGLVLSAALIGVFAFAVSRNATPTPKAPPITAEQSAVASEPAPTPATGPVKSPMAVPPVPEAAPAPDHVQIRPAPAPRVSAPVRRPVQVARRAPTPAPETAAPVTSTPVRPVAPLAITPAAPPVTAQPAPTPAPSIAAPPAASAPVLPPADPAPAPAETTPPQP